MTTTVVAGAFVFQFHCPRVLPGLKILYFQYASSQATTYTYLVGFEVRPNSFLTRSAIFHSGFVQRIRVLDDQGKTDFVSEEVVAVAAGTSHMPDLRHMSPGHVVT